MRFTHFEYILIHFLLLFQSLHQKVMSSCPKQANNPDLSRKEREMWNISIQALLHLGVIIMVAIVFHFMYILTLPSDMKLLKHLSDWTVGMCDLF